MQKHLFCAYIALFTSLTLFAQFEPGSVGFPLNAEMIMRSAHVHTQISTLVDQDSMVAIYATKTYDKDGFLLNTLYAQDTTYEDAAANPVMRDNYTYYPDGNVHNIVLEGYDMFEITHAFKYDKKGVLLSSLLSGAEPREYTYTYNDKGQIAHRFGKTARMAHENEDDTDGKIVMVDVEQYDYQWDDNGNLIGETVWIMQEWTQRMVYRYNDKQQLVATEMYYDNGDAALPAYVTTFKYDANGLMTESLTRETDFMIRMVYTYTYY